MDVDNIDYQRIHTELEQKQTLEIQKQFILERRKRMTVMASLLAVLVFTVVYGTLQNPFVFTLSKIGNRFSFGNRALFITWASSTGFVIQLSIIALFSLEKYQKKRDYTFIGIGSIFLFLTAIAPSLEEYPFWTWIHLLTAGLFGFFISIGFYPFIIWVARENPRLRKIVYVWVSIIWGGCFLWMFLLGNTGIFELWFFLSFIIFLLYLSLTLFEEKIVKTSIILLKDEENLNVGIEKIFVNLEKTRRVKKRTIESDEENEKLVV
ncbi:hypothetical protein KHQ82_01090 [Mycoplasmatota bacterium]|nr:hypothetical protein KHQ82_01090 [Mycoplasmatota bacterium]